MSDKTETKQDPTLLLEEHVVERLEEAQSLLKANEYDSCAELLSRTQHFVEAVIEAEQLDNLLGGSPGNTINKKFN